ncbi:claudin-8-like [Lampris incognitus]|uniref:claudin-8-like n=1 Tax=Lampris incognitus TaxID=2546036 RepID=UPI0024B619EA|nr:claudin-8-like [Lampris incognitus]
MVQGISEIAAVCVGLVGLIGAAATTGMPMWKVTAFIEENIIVMETRWEGLWMNCYRQANIRMQCKVYDSLLFLPPDLQAARGLMCCSLALSGLGLLVALAGMRCTSCVQNNDRVKTIILMVAGGMQFMASICVFIPVSWTGHVIIRDFYNPLLIDAQRRELGEALYIGWVTGAFLFASAVLFVCRRVSSNKDSFDPYHPVNMVRYKPVLNQPAPFRYEPVSSISSMRATPNQPILQSNSFVGNQPAQVMQNAPLSNNVGLSSLPAVYDPRLVGNGLLLYQSNSSRHPSTRSSNFVGSLPTPGNSLYTSQQTSPYSLSYAGNPSVSYNSSFHAVPQNPVFIGYSKSVVAPESHGGSSVGLYI